MLVALTLPWSARVPRVMSKKCEEIFLSYSSQDSFEASLLQFATEPILQDLFVKVWTYERDQSKAERQVGESLKRRVQNSVAAIFLVSAFARARR